MSIDTVESGNSMNCLDTYENMYACNNEILDIRVYFYQSHCFYLFIFLCVLACKFKNINKSLICCEYLYNNQKQIGHFPEGFAKLRHWYINTNSLQIFSSNSELI